MIRPLPITSLALLCAAPVWADKAPTPAAADAGPTMEKPEKTLVDGQPPLTQSMLEKYYEFFEWAFDTQLTVEQQKLLADQLVSAWKEKKDKEIADALDTLRNHDDVARMSAPERDMLRSQVQPQMLKELARDKSPISKWALAVFESAHKPLVVGKPALSRQVTDAYAEMVAFFVSQAAGGLAYEAQAPYRDEMAKALTTAWRKMKPADRESLSRAPLQWAAVRANWTTAPEAEKAKLKRDSADQLASYRPKEAAANKGDAGTTVTKEASANKSDAGTTLTEAGRWAQDVATSARPASLGLLTAIAGTGWKYQDSHW